MALHSLRKAKLSKGSQVLKKDFNETDLLKENRETHTKKIKIEFRFENRHFKPNMKFSFLFFF